MKKSKKGFTLIELLVVVLIIGILAAIAVPQYQLAVGKSKYSTLKNITHSIKEASEAYFLANGKYPSEYSQLDISLPGLKSTDTNSNRLYMVLKKGIYCEIYYPKSNQDLLNCSLYINKKQIAYYLPFTRNTDQRKYCLTYSIDKNDITNKICQQDTGKSPNQALFCTSSAGYCSYTY